MEGRYIVFFKTKENIYPPSSILSATSITLLQLSHPQKPQQQEPFIKSDLKKSLKKREKQEVMKVKKVKSEKKGRSRTITSSHTHTPTSAPNPPPKNPN
jgi:hypothetical protein